MRKCLYRPWQTGLVSFMLVGCQSVDNLLIGVSNRPSIPMVAATPPPLSTASAVLSYPDTHPVPFTAKGNPTYLQRWNGTGYENFYIKGINTKFACHAAAFLV